MVIKQTQIKLSAMEKDVCRNSQLKNKVELLKTDNLELKTKLNITETSISEKFDLILIRINICEDKLKEDTRQNK